MLEGLLEALTFTAAIGSGAVGGIFFAFSTFVMGALARLAPQQDIAAMNAINVTVLNPLLWRPTRWRSKKSKMPSASK